MNYVYMVYQKFQSNNDLIVKVFSSQDKACQFIKKHENRKEWSLYPDWLYIKSISVE